MTEFKVISIYKLSILSLISPFYSDVLFEDYLNYDLVCYFVI